MQRVRDERGAVAVVVALLMVPLLAFGAVSLDVAGMYADKQKLQLGADAAALGVAQVCSKITSATTQCPMATALPEAQRLASSNFTSGSPTASLPTLTTSKVTARTTFARQHVFAPILGVDSTTLAAQTTVMWGAPVAGTAILPLAFSWCEWKAQTGGAMPSGTVERTIYLSKTSTATDCTGPSGNLVPGGFGWLTTNPSSCNTTTSIDQILHSDPGNSVPSACSRANLEAVRGKTVLLPVFDEMYGTGSGATYVMYGYAAFTITGFHFNTHADYNDPCNGNDRCIKGYFSRMVDLAEGFTLGPGAPALGANLIVMTP